MKVSIKSDYACRAIEALALHHPNLHPLCIEEIARRRHIPPNYLVQILLELKRNGLIQSRRGKTGGYLLAQSPRQITVGEYSGIKGFRDVYGRLAVEFHGDQEATDILELVRYANVHTQKPLTKDELRFIAKYPDEARQLMTMRPLEKP